MLGQAIAGVLGEVAGLEVLGICSSSQACDLIRMRPPQLLVLDVDLKALPSYRIAADLLHQLRPDAKLLFITARANEFQLPANLAARTIAVMDQNQSLNALLALLQPWLPGCTHQLNAIESLSPRERRLLKELGNGQLNKQIAARLELSPATVETYRKHVAAKLGLSGGELVRLAVLYRCLRWDQGAERG